MKDVNSFIVTSNQIIGFNRQIYGSKSFIKIQILYKIEVVSTFLCSLINNKEIESKITIYSAHENRFPFLLTKPFYLIQPSDKRNF